MVLVGETVARIKRPAAQLSPPPPKKGKKNKQRKKEKEKKSDYFFIRFLPSMFIFVCLGELGVFQTLTPYDVGDGAFILFTVNTG